MFIGSPEDYSRAVVVSPSPATVPTTSTPPRKPVSPLKFCLIMIAIVAVFLIAMTHKDAHHCPIMYPHYMSVQSLNGAPEGVCYAGNNPDTTDYVLPSH